MKHYTKADIEIHGTNGPYHSKPSVNVKAHGRYLVPAVMKEFNCCEATAQKALEYVWESAVEQFWEQAPELVDHYLGKAFRCRNKVYSSGRSGGWLYVDDISKDVETWDAIKVSAWGRFEKGLRANVEWYSSEGFAFEMIEANDWAPADALLDSPEEEKEEEHKAACADIITQK